MSAPLCKEVIKQKCSMVPKTECRPKSKVVSSDERISRRFVRYVHRLGVATEVVRVVELSKSSESIVFMFQSGPLENILEKNDLFSI